MSSGVESRRNSRGMANPIWPDWRSGRNLIGNEEGFELEKVSQSIFYISNRINALYSLMQRA
jgi:zona occludens toxin (predicted ATPase)